MIIHIAAGLGPAYLSVHVVTGAAFGPVAVGCAAVGYCLINEAARTAVKEGVKVLMEEVVRPVIQAAVNVVKRAWSAFKSWWNRGKKPAFQVVPQAA